MGTYCSCTCKSKEDIINEEDIIIDKSKIFYEATSPSLNYLDSQFISDSELNFKSMINLTPKYEISHINIFIQPTDKETINSEVKVKKKKKKKDQSKDEDESFQSNIISPIVSPLKRKSVVKESPFKFNQNNLNTENLLLSLIKDNQRPSFNVKSNYSSPRKKSTLIQTDKKIVIFLVYPQGTKKDQDVYPTMKSNGFDKISVDELIINQNNNSSEIVVTLLLEKIFNSTSNKFIISGYPKNLEDIEVWKRITSNYVYVSALVMITYTRKEFENEIIEREKVEGKRISLKEAMSNFDYFLRNTMNISNEFGSKKCIKITAKIEDKLIATTILKSDQVSPFVSV